ncbi:2639_t:CDS:1, partial [Gigaspora rosea]
MKLQAKKLLKEVIKRIEDEQMNLQTLLWDLQSTDGILDAVRET